jgi:hypothetical protein
MRSEDELADELARRMSELPTPADGEDAAVAAARRAVRERSGEQPSRVARPRHRRLSTWSGRLVAAGLACLIAAGVALGVTRPWDRGDAPLVPASRSTAEKIAADPLLSGLVWLSAGAAPHAGPIRIQELPPEPSLAFPPGVTFHQAFRRLFDSLETTGALPPEARLSRALPLGKTMRLPAAPSEGVRIDLRSPRGYLIPSGVIPEGFSLPATWTRPEVRESLVRARREGLVIPLGARIDIPRLARCQILDPRRPTKACRLEPWPRTG